MFLSARGCAVFIKAIEHIRSEFPIFERTINDKPLIYFDNAATTLKPKKVVDTIANHYLYETSNIHRGVHYLSEKATESFENVRSIIKNFINAKNNEEVIFTKGTTDSINNIAKSFGKRFIQKGDEILISHMEHHSNIVPWQMLAEDLGCHLKVCPIDDNGELDLITFEKMLSPKTKLVSMVYVSNSLGTINPIQEIISLAHANNTPVLVDAAQAIAHIPIDVQVLDCDFLAFSGHKIFGPTGVGVLYGKKSLLEQLPPFQGGGDMILKVSFEKTIYNHLPYRLEAGTPHIAGVIGLGSAIQFVQDIGFSFIGEYEHSLLVYATRMLQNIQQLKIIGTAQKKSSILSFVIENIHPHDIGTYLDNYGIAIRTGHHCTQPVMDRFKIPATSRASLCFYNTTQEIDRFAEVLQHIVKVFS